MPGILLLHEAIAAVLAGAGRPLTAAELTEEINLRGLYQREDGLPLSAKQVGARIRRHPELFTTFAGPRPTRFALSGTGPHPAPPAPGTARRGWLSIRVELVDGAHLDAIPLPGRPGRLMLVGPYHTFRELAAAIDLAFGRWDLGHLHEFQLADGRRLGMAEYDEFGEGIIDDAYVRVAETVRPGEEFDYVFDLGDHWLHRCRVEAADVDPVHACGTVPTKPVPIWGWGWIPDQHGRRREDDSGDDPDKGEGPDPATENGRAAD